MLTAPPRGGLRPRGQHRGVAVLAALMCLATAARAAGTAQAKLLTCVAAPDGDALGAAAPAAAASKPLVSSAANGKLVADPSVFQATNLASAACVFTVGGAGSETTLRNLSFSGDPSFAFVSVHGAAPAASLPPATPRRPQEGRGVVRGAAEDAMKTAALMMTSAAARRPPLKYARAALRSRFTPQAPCGLLALCRRSFCGPSGCGPAHPGTLSAPPRPHPNERGGFSPDHRPPPPTLCPWLPSNRARRPRPPGEAQGSHTPVTLFSSAPLLSSSGYFTVYVYFCAPLGPRRRRFCGARGSGPARGQSVRHAKCSASLVPAGG